MRDLELNAPVRVECDADGRVAGLVVQPQIIGEPRWGRPAPRAAAAPERLVACDRIVVAIGQDIDSAPFEALGIPCSRGKVVAAEDGSIEGFDGLYAGGDCQSGPATVIRAINAGGRSPLPTSTATWASITRSRSMSSFRPCSSRASASAGAASCSEREAAERVGDFEMVEIGLTEEEAMQEASRCLRCDHFGFGALSRGKRPFQW